MPRQNNPGGKTGGKKTRRRLRPAPEIVARPGGAWLLPWAGVVALVFAWLAMLGGVSDRTLDWRPIFSPDTFRFHVMHQSLFVLGDSSASDWGWSAASFFFPEFVFQWPAFALGADVRAVLYAFSLAQVGFVAAGWMLVCDLLYGKSPVRRAAVWLLHALAFLVLAWRGNDVLGMHLVGAWHYGAWASLPWLLWLSLRALDGDGLSDGKSRAAMGGMLALLTLATASDLVIFSWFVFPAALCALLTVRRDISSIRTLCVYLAALAAGTLLGPALAETSGIRFWRDPDAQFSFNPELVGKAVETLADIMRRLAVDNGLEALVWILFVAVGLWRAAMVAPRLDIFSPRRGKEYEGVFHSLLGVSSSSQAHRFVALFIPFSAAAAVCAVLATGNLHPYPWVHPEINYLTRHFLPFVYFPLFVGWALLPWKFPRGRVGLRSAVLGSFALVVLLAVPKALSIERAGLDPFATPFQRCFAENARRLGWRAGVGVSDAELFHPLTANPAAGVEWMVSVWVNRVGARPRLHFNGILDVNWWRRGDFQFVAVNLFNGRVFGRPPRAGDKGCAPTYPEFLNCIQATHGILDEATARDAFGEPSEVIDCAGVGLFHYDPPLRFDPPDNLHGWEVRPSR